jgi:hypothetical protein
VISIQDLILSKESLARPKDLLAAEELRAMRARKASCRLRTINCRRP